MFRPNRIVSNRSRRELASLVRLCPKALEARSYPGAGGTFIHPFDDDNFGRFAAGGGADRQAGTGPIVAIVSGGNIDLQEFRELIGSPT